MNRESLVKGTEVEHEKAKKTRKQLDNYTCSLCGKTAADVGKYRITAHHLIKKELGGGPDPNNMITLCRDCHDKVHAPDSEFEYEKN